jgi:hypothetical protein
MVTVSVESRLSCCAWGKTLCHSRWVQSEHNAECALTWGIDIHPECAPRCAWWSRGLVNNKFCMRLISPKVITPGVENTESRNSSPKYTLVYLCLNIQHSGQRSVETKGCLPHHYRLLKIAGRDLKCFKSLAVSPTDLIDLNLNLKGECNPTYFN